jgi:phosphopantothenoylcysteine decarboxylase/phosphopantothenate--cysteine ligase
MSHLQGKKILLAVTGSIAAYKTPELVRQLIRSGADVKVILTPSATDFVTPLALATVSRHPVFSNVHDGTAWNNHVALGRWADVMLIAPCSANTLAKLANGLCDNLVCAVYLSATCPVFIAPAMDEDMWLHPSTTNNLAKVHSFGNHIIPVAHGELASGLVGPGRMAEPEDLVNHLSTFFNTELSQPLRGTKALVTAGPTYERIDPVRFIGNFSTGKMGIALAEALAEKGAEVTLVLGPSHYKAHHPRIHTVQIESAEEMFQAAVPAFKDAQIAILAAAVADYRPGQVASHKIKKAGDTLDITLTKTTDILKTLGTQKTEDQLLVGFALETNDEHANAMLKLKSKGADIIVLNSLNDEGAGFGHDTNKVTLLHRDGSDRPLPLLSKHDTAAAIVNAILEYRHEPHTV